MKVYTIGGVSAEHLAIAARRAAEAMRELGEQIAIAEQERIEQPLMAKYYNTKATKFYVERKPEPWQGQGKRKKGRIK